MSDQPRYTIQDAADALGLTLPGLVWHEGQMSPSDAHEIEQFIKDHSGHSLVAEAATPVRHANGGEAYRPMILFCRACSEKLDAAVEESGWDKKIGYD